jgi:hypothetical protein
MEEEISAQKGKRAAKMKVYCSIYTCDKEAKYHFFNGLLPLCEKHKNYLKKINLFNLGGNCGRKLKKFNF